MDITTDIPWPWSLSPAAAIQWLVHFTLPVWFGRIVIGVLAALLINLSLGKNGLIGVFSRLLRPDSDPSHGDVPMPIRGILLSVAFGLLGWFVAYLPALILISLFVIFFTLITYKGAARGRGGRLAVIIALRLFALLLTVFTIARPAFVLRSEDKVATDLIIALDLSKSMTIPDEVNGQKRIDAVRAVLKRCEPILEDLKNENQITVYMTRFAGDTGDYDPNAPADGDRSDYGNLLDSMYQRFGTRPNLRGLLVIGDGADNGYRFDAAREAIKWRSIQCPINCFAVGSPTPPQGAAQLDLVAATINVEPAPVYVKGRMFVRATVHAYGCDGVTIQPKLFVNDQEYPIEKIRVNNVDQDGRTAMLPLTEKNEMLIETTAPTVPGEIKVTLKLPKLAGETNVENNDISTYVTVVKEGVSVLLVDSAGDESRYIRWALGSDPRIRLYQINRQTEAVPVGAEADLLNLERQGYDVIILGNVSMKRLTAGNKAIMEKIRKLVSEKGVGFMMMGGTDSFGGTPGEPGSGDWKGTPIADLLPVELNVSGQIGAPSEMHATPTAIAEGHYILRLASNEADSRKIWDRLNASAFKMSGMNRLAAAKAASPGKPGATVLATTEPGGKGEPVLVSQRYGKGRTLAFAGNETWRWRNFGLPDSFEGVEIHARFWKQLVIWLAQQENSEGNVWIKPDVRRLASGAKQSFSVGVKGKTGVELKGGRFDVKVIGPDGTNTPVQVLPDKDQIRGQFWKTDKPGEYRIEVNGMAVDEDKQKVEGKAAVRFLTYQDDSEMMNPAADLNFLSALSANGGGRSQCYRIDDLPEFLKEMKSAKLPNQKVKIKQLPDWRKKEQMNWFLPLLFAAFVAVLGLEWGLRRMWGMV